MKADTGLLAQRVLWAGQHALPLFFVLLALLLMATCAGWWTLRRSTVLRRHSTLSPALFRGLRIALGCAIVLAGVGVFTLLASQLGAGEQLGRVDLALTDALRSSVPRLALQMFAALTHLADTATLAGLCIVMALALIARGRRWLALCVTSIELMRWYRQRTA